MAKVSGLGDNLYIGGYDLSGDVGAVETVKSGPKPLEVTSINESAIERLTSLLDGEIDFSAFFNNATNQEHAILSTLPRNDTMVMFLQGIVLGNPVASMVAKQINYDITHSQDEMLAVKVQALSNGFGLEWGNTLTAGKQTFTDQTGPYSSIDFGTENYTSPIINIVSSSNASPSVVTTLTNHNLVVGDHVYISGHSVSTLNGNWAVASTPTTLTFTATSANSTGASDNTGTVTENRAFAMGIVSSSNASPSVVTTSVAHGLVVGDSINISGHSVSSLNGNWTVASTPLTTTFTATGANSTGASDNTGYVKKTSSNFGASANLMIFSVGANSSPVYIIKDSADDSSYTAVSGMTFASFSGLGFQRIKATAATTPIRRYLKLAISSGNFSTGVLVVAMNRYPNSFN